MSLMHSLRSLGWAGNRMGCQYPLLRVTEHAHVRLAMRGLRALRPHARGRNAVTQRTRQGAAMAGGVKILGDRLRDCQPSTREANQEIAAQQRGNQTSWNNDQVRMTRTGRWQDA